MAGTKTCEMEVREQLKDLTECCVCSETYKDPKILPCIHTFCMKCLEEAGVKTSKSPGDQMPCPMCRKEFTIPMEGYAALQKNFFMVKLIEMAKISSPSGGPGLCEACMDKESVSTSGSEVPLADMYCADCPKKLCHECSRQHRKYKLTRNHQVVAAVDSQSKDQIPALSSCKKHEREYILYCSECKELLCISCFGERHQNHRLQDVGNVVEGFKNEVKDILSGLEVCVSEVLEKKEILNCELKEYFENLESLKLHVREQRDATIELVSEHADLVMQDIAHLKLQKHKEVEAEIKDSEAALTCLDSFKVDCSKVMTKGSASDICCSIDELKETFEFFKKVHEFDIEVKTYFHQISFHLSDFREFVKTGDYNIIGTIQGLGVFGCGDASPDSSMGSPQMKPLGPSATPFYASWSPKMFGRKMPDAAGFPPMEMFGRKMPDAAEFPPMGMFGRKMPDAAGFPPMELFGRKMPYAAELFGRETPDAAGLFGRETPDAAGLFGRETPDAAGLFGRETPDAAGLFGRETPDAAGLFGRETPDAAGFPPMDSGFSRGYRPPWSAQWAM